jgi:hypothetical protein
LISIHWTRFTWSLLICSELNKVIIYTNKTQNVLIVSNIIM